ncbi:MAG: hypothetical protein HKN23_08785 [Verrucomicrobiales bacterium]|nr:hypothetical protein [Verrucomicrobiales bacterium]
MSESKAKSILTSPWGILSIVGNALGIGNFQENYLPQLIRWKDFLAGIFDVVNRVAQACLAPLENLVSWVFRIPDWEFPPALASYFLLNAVLLSAVTRVTVIEHFSRGHTEESTWMQKLKAGLSLSELIGTAVLVGIVIIAPGLILILAGVLVMFYEKESSRWGWFIALIYGIFSLVCLPVMIFDFRGLGQVAGIASAGSLYIIIITVALLNLKKSTDKTVTLQLLGGPALFVVLAFVFSA